MRRFIGLGIAALLLTACNMPEQAPANDSAVQGAAAAPADSPTLQAAAPAKYNPDFPTGFQPPFAYSVRSRAVEDSADGQIHRLVIEYKQGDTPTVDKQLEELLVAKGYKRYKTLERGEELVGDYGNSGKRITVTTAPSKGNLKLGDGSLGTVYFVWKD